MECLIWKVVRTLMAGSMKTAELTCSVGLTCLAEKTWMAGLTCLAGLTMTAGLTCWVGPMRTETYWAVNLDLWIVMETHWG